MSQENRIPGSTLKKNLKIILGTSQTLVKMQRTDIERQYYCLKNFTLERLSLPHNKSNNTAESLET